MSRNIDDLSFDRILSFQGNTDRKMKLQIGVYMGRPSMTVWHDDSKGGPLARFVIDRGIHCLISSLIRKAAAATQFKETISITKQNKETKKREDDGHIVVGRDDDGVFIGISGQKATPTKFTIKMPYGFEIKDKDAPVQNIMAAEMTASFLDGILSVASGLSSFKADRPAGGSGGGGGGRGSIF
jgi:hypothetical protein